MKPKDKAKELVEWSIINGASKEVAKLFANKIVDEILEECRIGMDWYWQEVKHEIENL